MAWSCEPMPRGMDYMVAIAVPDFDGVNSPHRETIPPAHYAVFTIDGRGAHPADVDRMSTLRWMPQSGYKAVTHARV